MREHAYRYRLPCLIVALTLAAAPLGAEIPLPAHADVNVARDTSACSGLDKYADEDSRDECCAQCVAQIREVASFTTSYMSSALRWRVVLICLSLLGAGAFLGWAAWRSHTLKLRPLWTIAGGLLILGLIAALGSVGVTWLTQEEGRKLVTADRILRGLTEVGLIPTTNQQAHVHCAELIETMVPRSDSRCGTELLTYGGAFADFDKIDKKHEQLDAEKARRAQDAMRLISSKVTLRLNQNPATAGAVLRQNDLLSEVADARLRWLRYLWLDALAVVAFGALGAWLLALLFSFLRRRRHQRDLRLA